MARSRSTLHKTKLPELKAFCEKRGWLAEPLKGGYEVLRMRHAGRKDPLIVYDRNNAPEHYTTWGESARMVTAMLRERRKEKTNAS